MDSTVYTQMDTVTAQNITNPTILYSFIWILYCKTVKSNGKPHNKQNLHYIKLYFTVLWW